MVKRQTEKDGQKSSQGMRTGSAVCGLCTRHTMAYASSAKSAVMMPVLASTELQALLASGDGHDYETERRRVGTACADVNGILPSASTGQSKGIESGRITCISGDSGTGKSMIALHLVADFLLDKPTGGSSAANGYGGNENVALIDSTGSFDVLSLHQILVLRLWERDGGQVVSAADKLLERLQIIRIFDLQGLAEAIGEIQQRLKQAGVPMAEVEQDHGDRKQMIQRLRVVPDSQDEDETEYEAMQSIDMKQENDKASDKSIADSIGLGMIVLDNLYTPASLLLKSNYVQAQAQLTSSLRSLASITRSSNLVTLILNGITKKMTKDKGQARPDNIHTVEAADVYPSVFAANMLRPALEHSLGHFVDLHLLLSKLPRRHGNVQTVTGDAMMSKAEMVHVLEVYMDRYGDCLGKWAAFKLEQGIRLQSAL